MTIAIHLPLLLVLPVLPVARRVAARGAPAGNAAQFVQSPRSGTRWTEWPIGRRPHISCRVRSR
jgi:hypothetical protein